MSNSRLNLTYWDYNKESSQSSFRGAALTEVNFGAQEILMDNLVAAVEAVTLGNLVKDLRIAEESKPGAGPASSTDAQREMKWVIRAYDDTTFEPVQASIPCADHSLLAANSDLMDPTSAEYIALVAAFEAFQLSKGGNTCTVIDIVLVGRNL